MLYDKYKRKVLGIKRILKVVVRFLPLIITVSAVVTAGSAALVAAKGIVTLGDVPAEVEYGKLPVIHNSFAFLSDIDYQYRADGSDVWSDTYPNKPGSYHVRAVGDASFGQTRYSDPKPFKIIPKNIDVIVESESVVHGDKPDIMIPALASGDYIVCTEYDYTYSEKDKKYTDVTPKLESIRIFNEKGEDITATHYNIEVLSMPITVTQRPISITIGSSGKTYDGTPFSYDIYDYPQEQLAEGDRIIHDIKSSITEVGETVNDGAFTFLDAEGRDVTAHYNAKVTVGSLTVDKRPLNYSFDAFSAVYNANPVVWGDENSLKLSEETSLSDGHKIVFVDQDTVYPTVAGTHINPTKFIIVDKDGNDVTDNYSLNFDGESSIITITQCPITISTNSQSWVYDGEAHEDLGFSCSADLIEGHTVKLMPETETVSLTYVSSAENKFEIAIMDENGAAVTENYSIIYEYGTVEISKRPLHIKPIDAEKVYDATPLFSTGIELADSESESLAKDDHVLALSSDMTENIINAGELSYTVSADAVEIYVLNGDGEKVDMTDNYEIIPVNGTLTVSRRPISVSPAPSQSKTFDGHPLVTSKLEWTEENAENEGLIKKADEHFIEVPEYSTVSASYGDYYWDLKRDQVKIYALGDDGEKIYVTDNYDITTPAAPVLLSISKETVYVKPVDVAVIYDGKKHAATEIEFAGGSKGLIDLGFTVEYASPVEIFSSTGSKSVSTVYIPKAEAEGNIRIYLDGEDVTDNYLINVTDPQSAGTITINARPITLSPVLKNKVYNGYALTSSEVDSTEENTVENTGLLTSLGHKVITTYSSENANVGSYTWDITETPVKIMAGDTDVTDNYVITYGSRATADITRRPISVTGDLSEADKVYDGKELTSDKTISTKEDLAANVGLLTSLEHNVVASYSSVKTNVDEYTWELKAEDVKIMCGDVDVTDNYAITPQNAPEGEENKAKITERTIYIVPAINEDRYNSKTDKYEMIYNADHFYADGIKTEDDTSEKAVPNGLVINHTVSLTVAGRDYIRTKGTNVGEDGAALPLSFYKSDKNGENTIEDIESILTFTDPAGLIDDEQMKKNYKVVFKTREGSDEGTEVVYITERTVYVVPTVDPNVNGNHYYNSQTERYEMIYNADHFYADGIIPENDTSLSAIANGLVADHKIELTELGHIRTSRTDVGTALALNFYKNETTVKDIEDILTFSDPAGLIDDEQMKKNYKVVFKTEVIEDIEVGTKKVNITERTVYIIPTIDPKQQDGGYNVKVYDGDYFYADGIKEFRKNEANTGIVVGKGHEIALINAETNKDYLRTSTDNASTKTDKISSEDKGHKIQFYTQLSDSSSNTIENIEAILVFTDKNDPGTERSEQLMKNYKVVYVDDQVEVHIERRVVTVTPALDEKVYNGDALTATKTKFGEQDGNRGLLNGHKTSIYLGKDTKDAGSYKWTLDENGKAKLEFKSATAKPEAGYETVFGKESYEQCLIVFDDDLPRNDVTKNYFFEYPNTSLMAYSAKEAPPVEVTIKRQEIYLSPYLDYSDSDRQFNASALIPKIGHNISGSESAYDSWKLGNDNNFTVSAEEFALLFSQEIDADFASVGKYTWAFADSDSGEDATLKYYKPGAAATPTPSFSTKIVIKLGETDVTDNFDITYATDPYETTINKREVKLTPYLEHGEVSNGSSIYDAQPFTTKFGYSFVGTVNTEGYDSWSFYNAATYITKTFEVDLDSFESYRNVGDYKLEMHEDSGVDKVRLTYTAPEGSGFIGITADDKELSRVVIKHEARDVTENFDITYGDAAKATITARTVYVVPTVDQTHYYNSTTKKYEMIYNADHFYADGIAEEKDTSESAIVNGLVADHKIGLNASGRNYIRTEKTDVGENLPLNFYTADKDGNNTISDIENILTFTDPQNSLTDAQMKANYEIVFKTKTVGGKTVGTKKVDITVRTVYIIPTINPANQIEGFNVKVYDDDYFYAYGIIQDPSTVAQNIGIVPNKGHTISFGTENAYKYLRTETLDATTKTDKVSAEDKGFKILFYTQLPDSSSNTIEDIEDILVFTDENDTSPARSEQLMKNYKVVYVDDQVEVHIERRVVKVKPALDDKIYDGDDLGPNADIEASIGGDTGILSSHTQYTNIGADDIDISLAGHYKWTFTSSADGTTKAKLEFKSANAAPDAGYVTVFGEAGTDNSITIYKSDVDVTANYYFEYDYGDMTGDMKYAEATISKREVTLSPELKYSDPSMQFNATYLDPHIMYTISGLEDGKDSWKLGYGNKGQGNQFTVSAKDFAGLFTKYIDADFASVGNYTWAFADSDLGEDATLQYYKPGAAATPTSSFSTKIVIKLGGDDVTDNFDITYATDPYETTINKKDVTLTPYLVHGEVSNGSSIYDAQPFTTKFGYSIVGTVNTEGYNSWILNDKTFKVELDSFEKYANVGDYELTMVEDKGIDKVRLTYTAPEGSEFNDISDSDNKLSTILISYINADYSYNVTEYFNISYGDAANATITEKTVYIKPYVSTPTKVYDNEHFYADGITTELGIYIYGNEMAFGDRISLDPDYREYIRTENADVGVNLPLNFYKTDKDGSKPISDIEDILIFHGQYAHKDNYKIIFHESKSFVTITKRTVYVAPYVSSGTKVYDGEYMYASGLKEHRTGEADTGLILDAGHELYYVEGSRAIHSSAKNVGKWSMECVGNLNNGSTVTITNGDIKNYNIVYVNNYGTVGSSSSLSDDFTIEITKRTVYFVPVVDSQRKVWDGGYLYASDVAEYTSKNTTNDIGLVSGHWVAITGTIRTPSSDANNEQNPHHYLSVISDNAVSIFYEGDETANYNIIFVENAGMISGGSIQDDFKVYIDKRDVTVTPSVYDTSMTYDGDYFYANTFSHNDDLGNRFDFSEFSAHTNGKNVGRDYYFSEYGDEGKIVITDAYGNEVQNNYNITYDYSGVPVSIEKRYVAFSPISVYKAMYNGKKHQCTGVEIIGEPLASGQRFEFTPGFSYYDSYNDTTAYDGFAGDMERNATAVVTIEGEIRIYYGDDDVTDNYEIDTTSYTGELEVIALLITVTPDTDIFTKVYDGEKFTIGSASIYSEYGKYSYRIEKNAMSSSPNVNADGYDVAFNPGDIRIINSEGVDVTDMCIITYKSVHVSITPRDVYIITSSADRTYNGLGLICHEWQLDDASNVGSCGLVGGDGKSIISVTFDGNAVQTDVGSCRNLATAKAGSNYNVIVSYGTLRVDPVQIHVTIKRISTHYYNGDFIRKGIRYSTSCSLDGVTVDVSAIKLIYTHDTFTGADDLEYAVKFNGADMKKINYVLTADAACNIVVNPLSIKIGSYDLTANYDGTYHSSPKLKLPDNIPAGHTVRGEAIGSFKGHHDITDWVYNELGEITIIDSHGKDVTDQFRINEGLKMEEYLGKITVVHKQQ